MDRSVSSRYPTSRHIRPNGYPVPADPSYATDSDMHVAASRLFVKWMAATATSIRFLIQPRRSEIERPPLRCDPAENRLLDQAIAFE
ncbi:hypothetical protein [Rhodococcus qingshengii]|uniref:hypothetical protein n=1 Tax=Rhodococcus qingshengii TaxID=334542 RepID=UPI001BDF1377|nr:hypothetical protein [Rhodococcus qingshengii]